MTSLDHELEKFRYHKFCFEKGLNKKKTELVSHGHSYYTIKEIVLNPYSFDEYLADKKKKEYSLFQKLKNLF